MSDAGAPDQCVARIEAAIQLLLAWDGRKLGDLVLAAHLYETIAADLPAHVVSLASVRPGPLGIGRWIQLAALGFGVCGRLAHLRLEMGMIEDAPGGAEMILQRLKKATAAIASVSVKPFRKTGTNHGPN